MLFASGAKYAALADVPGFSTSTFFARGEPILRIPTLSYLAGVPGDLTPSMRWKLTFAAAGPAAARTSALARDRTRAGVVMAATLGNGCVRQGEPAWVSGDMAEAITVIATRDDDAALLVEALSSA